MCLSRSRLKHGLKPCLKHGLIRHRLKHGLKEALVKPTFTHSDCSRAPVPRGGDVATSITATDDGDAADGGDGLSTVCTSVSALASPQLSIRLPRMDARE